MSKPKPKKKVESIVLRPRESKTVQKTIRIPRAVQEWLQLEVSRVGKGKLTIPGAIVQILEAAYTRAAQERSA